MNRLKKLITEWVIPILIAIGLTFLINKFVFFKVTVPTGSMLPTIQLKDQIMVTKIYNFNNLKRGDIVVFDSKELKILLIKRLIGLPGDTVKINEDGKLYINGKLIDEPYVKNKGGNYGTYKVPKDKYFFLGDNRVASFDARSWNNKYISKEDILGKARLTVYPFNRFGLLK